MNKKANKQCREGHHGFFAKFSIFFEKMNEVKNTKAKQNFAKNSIKTIQIQAVFFLFFDEFSQKFCLFINFEFFHDIVLFSRNFRISYIAKILHFFWKTDWSEISRLKRKFQKINEKMRKFSQKIRRKIFSFRCKP